MMSWGNPDFDAWALKSWRQKEGIMLLYTEFKFGAENELGMSVELTMDTVFSVFSAPPSD